MARVHPAIPTTRYTCPRWLQDEWSHVFARTWLLGAHSSELAEVGSFVRLSFGRYEVVLVRQEDKSARAFQAVCQHRGTPLCAGESGRVESFVCPYHRWEYALDGGLVAAPGAGLSASAMATVALPGIECEERLGFVWFRLGSMSGGSMSGSELSSGEMRSGDAPSIEEHLAPVADAIGMYRPEEFRLANSSVVAMAANWKTVQDANNEAYHLASLHPELVGIVDAATVVDEAFGIHSGSTIPFTQYPFTLSVAEGSAEASEDGGVALSPSVSLREKRQFALFPNVQLNFTPLRLEVYRQWPHATDPGRCEFEEMSYARPKHAPSQPTRRRGEHGDFSVGDVLDADLAIAVRVQRGMATGALDALRLTERESNIAHFHRVLGERVLGERVPGERVPGERIP